MKKIALVGLILLGFLLVFPGNPLQTKQVIAKETFDFLKENQKQVDLDNPEEAFSLLDPYLEPNEFFLAGETHTILPNEELRLALLKYLHQNASVRYYVPEAPFSLAYYLNRYLQTGNEEYLDLVLPYWHRNYEMYEFYRKLRQYNLTLEPGERIEIIGFDITGTFRQIIAVYHLLEMIAPQDAPSGLEKPLAELKELKQTFAEERQNPDHYRKAQTDFYAGLPDHFFEEILPPVEEINEQIKENPQAAEKALGEDFFTFQFVVQNIIDGFEAFELMFTGRWNSFEFRDRRSFENFLKLYPQLEGGNFFAQWGDLHTFRRDYHGFPWLAAHLASEKSPLQDKVFSILYIYEDCNLLEPYSLDGSLPYSSNFQHMDLLKEAAPGDLVLFDLQGEVSPFARDLFFLEEGASGGTTLDYFQMVIYFEGFEGASPLYGNR